MIKVLIVDDRDIIRDGYKLYLRNIENINVTGEAADGKEALELIKNNNYDVVLMDINMPKMNGIAATHEMIALKPGIKILANSFNYSATNIYEMVMAGAIGFITKDESRADFIEAINLINRGSIYLSDKIDSHVYDKVSAYLKYPVKKRAISA